MTVLRLQSPPERLVRFSRAMAFVTAAGIGLIVLTMVLVFVTPDWTRNFALARLGQSGQGISLTPMARLAAAAVTAVPIGVMIYGLWQVRALFSEFAAGRIFTESSARRLQLFAASVMAQAVLGPLSSAGLLLAFTFDNPPGQRLLGIAFSINDYVALIVGGVLFAIAWAMREAARIAEENASFV